MLRQLSLIILFNFFLFGNLVAAQNNYQTTVSLLYLDREDDDDDTATAKAMTLEYSLRSIKINDQPRAEATFLQRASSIGLLVSQADIDTSTNKQDSDGYGIVFSYLSPETPFAFGASYSDSDNNLIQGSSTGKTSSDTTGISLGYFVEQNTLVTLGYSKSDFESNDFILAYDSIESTGLNLKKVFLNQDGTAINIQAEIEKDDYSSNDENTTIGIAGDYYFNIKHSIGASILDNSGDKKSVVGRSYGINTQLFVTPFLSIVAEFTTFKADNKSLADDSDTWTLVGAMRF